MKKIVYNLFLGLVFILKSMPKSLRRAFFRFLANMGYLFARKTNKVIKTNLDFVYNPQSKHCQSHPQKKTRNLHENLP